MSNQRYSTEFKVEVVSQLESLGRTIGALAELSQEYNISSDRVIDWYYRFGDHSGALKTKQQQIFFNIRSSG